MLYKPVLCEDDLVVMQSDVTMIVDLVDTCGLHLNLKKTKCLVILIKHHPPPPPPPSFTVSNTSIEQVPSFCYLGVMISSDLSWSLHISLTCSKAKRFWGFLCRNFRNCDASCLSYLYKVQGTRPCFFAILEYCSCVWDYHQVYNK